MFIKFMAVLSEATEIVNQSQCRFINFHCSKNYCLKSVVFKFNLETFRFCRKVFNTLFIIFEDFSDYEEYEEIDYNHEIE